jgi:Spy/CpxP family protein refolding chaperone
MRPWIKRTLIGTFGASLVLGGLSACGHHRSGAWSMSESDSAQMRERMLERVGKKLTLDDAQKQRLAVLATKLKEQRAALVGNAADPRAEFQALVAGPKFERERAQSLVNAKTDALRSKSPEVIAAAADFFDSLKPEQQQQVREFLNRRHGWRG